MTELILALDVPDRERALLVARACAPHLDAIKIGYPLVLSAGLSVARELDDLGLPAAIEWQAQETMQRRLELAADTATPFSRSASV